MRAWIESLSRIAVRMFHINKFTPNGNFKCLVEAWLVLELFDGTTSPHDFTARFGKNFLDSFVRRIL